MLYCLIAKMNMLIDILTGIMVRAKSGFDVKDEHDLGSLFIAIDPSVFQPIDSFKQEMTKLVNDVLAIKPMKGFSEVRIPGFSSEKIRQHIQTQGYFDVPDAIWKEFETYYKQITKKPSV